jgi:hypothetical protein
MKTVRLLFAALFGLAAASAVAQTAPGFLYPMVPFGQHGSSTPPPPSGPTNISPPVISGTPQVGQTLTASDGTWTGSPTSFADQWLLGGSPISGATGATFVPVTADIGGLISVQVTATNANGSSSATSAAVGPVTSSGPAPSALLLVDNASNLLLGNGSNLCLASIASC